MDPFLEKYLKIQSEYFKRMKLLFILDLISLFCIFFAISIIFQLGYFLEHASLFVSIPISVIKIIPALLAFIPAIIVAYVLHRKDHKINVILLIENKYPELREKLRTAYDNIDETNEIVESLKNVVLSEEKKVSAPLLLAKIVVITKIVVLILFSSSATIIFLDSEKYSIPVDNIIDFTNTIIGGIGGIGGTNGVYEPGEGPEDPKGSPGFIPEKMKIASIEGKDVDLTIFPGTDKGYELQKVSQPDNQFIISADFPVDVLGSNVSDGGYSILMKKTEAEKKLIEDYAVERSKI